MKLDTGAQCNVLPYSLYCKLTREKLRKSNTRLVSYTDHKIPVMGKATLPVKLKGKFHPVEFHVIEHPATPVREGTFFLGGGRVGEFWYFFPKKCWPSLAF